MAKLTPEIVSLVHHVKLNESGWWNKFVQNLIITTYFAKNNAPYSKEELFGMVQSEFSINLDKIRFNDQFDILISQRILIKTEMGKYCLEENTLSDYEILFQKEKEIINYVKERFFSLAKKYCHTIDGDNLWADFNEIFLNPLIQEIGAKTYDLLNTSNIIDFDRNQSFLLFIKKYSESTYQINKIISEFLSVEDERIRKYILQKLSSYFFTEATSLKPEVIDKIYELSKIQTSMKVFVDTNFLLTILDLHDNPSNEATNSLLELLKEVKNKVDIKFYILPHSIREFQNLIRKTRDYIKSLKPSMQYFKVINESEEFSGLIKKYSQKCEQQNMVLNIDEYFEPYLENLSILLKSKKVEIHNENLDRYSLDQKSHR